MTQRSLHDFFKVKGTPPKIQSGTSPKSAANRTRKLSIMSQMVSPRRKCPKRDTELFDQRKIQIQDELNLEDVALSYINAAIDKNSPGEINLNEIYNHCSQHEIKSLENPINYNGKITRLYDKAAESLFKAIFVDVFQNEINCEFFNQMELKLIASIFKLSIISKTIVTRLLKWKKPWYRIQDINDSLNQSDIDDFPLNEITSHSCENGIFKMLNCDDNIMAVLQLMNLRELQDISKQLKRPVTLSKDKLIEQLLGIAKMKVSLFPGLKSPRNQLLSIINKISGPIIQLSELAWNIINRLLTLLYPVQSRFETLSDVVWMITEVDMGKRMYPDAAIDHMPVFRNRQHLIDYVEAKSTLINITTAIKFKDWTTVKKLSGIAYDKLMSAEDSKNSFIVNTNDLTLPSYIRRFTASFVWSKVLMLSIDSPKKDPDYATFVGQFLKRLLEYDGVICASAGRCCNELSAVEMKYNKKFDECARLIERGLSQKHLSIVIEAELIERAKKLSTKSSGIAECWKTLMTTLNAKRKGKFECSPIQMFIEAKKMQSQCETVAKSVWVLDECENTNTYAQVEVIAQSYYMKHGFTKGLHCEGSLPITLCACAFWNEIYNVSVPGAFICRYQHAPLDLWSSNFIENRQEKIQERIAMLNRLSVDDLCETMHYSYLTNRDYTSLISGNLVHDSEDIKEIIRCLGSRRAIGLCLILLNDYYHLSAGFPDLIVWNPQTWKCKIVEVKGPGDSLSIKQKLWINRLMELGIDTEVCYVKAK